MAEEGRKGLQKILTKQFDGIFNGNSTLSDESIESIYNEYLANGSFTAVKNPSGPSFLQINSMLPVIDYLSKHPEVKKLNFKNFKEHVDDVSALADYLKTSSVKLVGISDGITAVAKAALDEAVAFRKATNNPLKVQYLA